MMTTQEEPAVRQTKTPPDGTEPIDPTADPEIPNWEDVPVFDRENGNGQPLTAVDLKLHELEQTLRAVFDREIGDIVAKAQQYGGGATGDLDIMAGAMRVVMPNLQNHQQGVMAALAFYQLGKVARSLASLASGVMPSFDNVRDSHVYGVMQMKVHGTGAWL
jgi:hypothetical protein